MDPNTHFDFLFFVGFAVFFGLITAGLSLLFARKTTDNDVSGAQNKPYTGGFDRLSSPKNAFTVRFFLMALFFILLTAEVILLLPWMMTCRSGDPAAACGAFVFLLLCVVGGFFEYKCGALRWK